MSKLSQCNSISGSIAFPKPGEVKTESNPLELKIRKIWHRNIQIVRAITVSLANISYFKPNSDRTATGQSYDSVYPLTALLHSYFSFITSMLPLYYQSYIEWYYSGLLTELYCLQSRCSYDVEEMKLRRWCLVVRNQFTMSSVVERRPGKMSFLRDVPIPNRTYRIYKKGKQTFGIRCHISATGYCSNV